MIVLLSRRMERAPTILRGTLHWAQRETNSTVSRESGCTWGHPMLIFRFRPRQWYIWQISQPRGGLGASYTGEERSPQPPKIMCIAGASNYFDILPRWLKTISGAIRESRSLSSPLRRAAETERPGRAGRPAPSPPPIRIRRSQPSHANGAPLTRGGPRTEEEGGEGEPGFLAKSRHRKKSPGGHGGRKSTGI